MTPLIALFREGLFKNIEGIRLVLYQGGCGGTRWMPDSYADFLAGYIHHPNVAGATVLVSAVKMRKYPFFRKSRRRDPQSSEPVLIFHQQRRGLGSPLS